MNIDLCCCMAHQPIHFFNRSKEGEHTGDTYFPFGLCGKAMLEGWAFCGKCKGLLRPNEGYSAEGERSYCQDCWDGYTNQDHDEYEEQKLREGEK